MPVVVLAAAAPPTTAPLRKSRRPRPSSFVRSSFMKSSRWPPAEVRLRAPFTGAKNAPFTRARQGPRASSFHLDAGRLDDRPPLLDLGLVKRIERCRRQFLARKNVLRDVGQLLAHGGVLERVHHCGIELGDHRLG